MVAGLPAGLEEVGGVEKASGAQGGMLEEHLSQELAREWEAKPRVGT